MTCDECNQKEACTKPCDDVQKILWKNNRVMERTYQNAVVCCPRNGEVHFSEIKQDQIDRFSEDDVIPWSSGNFKLRQTEVFIERFFNKIPCKDIAERYDVKENTVVSMYRNAVKELEKAIKTMDCEREGLKYAKHDKFTEEQKIFLLHIIFGFQLGTIARMFKHDPGRIGQKVKRMSDKYGAMFQGEAMSP